MVQRALDAVEAGVELEEPVRISGLVRDYQCTTCSQRMRLAFDGRGFVWTGKPCEFADGVVTEWELNVPSGKIVVANDLRTWFPSDEDYDVNGMLGCHLTTLGYAKVGMAHGFVGNTCPDVYRDGDDKFVIGSYHEELWNRETKEDYPNPEPCPWGESVANVCTDLWWYSIVDHDELVRRWEHYTPEDDREKYMEGWTVHVVDVRPGVYKFRQEQGIDRDEGIVEYATFEWVREPDPTRDYLKEEREKQLSATEVLIQHCLSWPTLYMGVSSLSGDRSFEAAIERWKGWSDRERAWGLARAADQVMCVLGGGIEWHENGFPRTSVSEEVKGLAAEYGDVPPFDFETSWYPISAGYGGLCLGAGVRDEYTRNNPLIDLAPSFVLLGLNICQNAIKFGEKPRLNNDVYPPAYETPFARERMKLFVKCYKGLRQRYPDVVFDAEFDRWMRETDLDRYVAEFNYGVTSPPKEEWGEPPPTTRKGKFFAFDSSKIDDGYFCWARGTWAKKEDAERYAIGVLAGTQSEMGHLHVDASARPPSMIPLKAVGRVLRGTGEGHSSAHLVVTFDYGTENMRGEMAFSEKDMVAVEQFDDERRYADLLEQHKIEYAELEAQQPRPKAKKKAVKKRRKKRGR
jgi:hypothetical protein